MPKNLHILSLVFYYKDSCANFLTAITNYTKSQLYEISVKIFTKDLYNQGCLNFQLPTSKLGYVKIYLFNRENARKTIFSIQTIKLHAHTHTKYSKLR